MVVLTQGYNHATLLGEVSAGPWHNAGGEGRAESAAFSLAIPEPSKSGEVYHTFVRCEWYGRVVPNAMELRQGDMALIEGKLSWSKGSGDGKAALAVTAWRVLKLASDLPATG